MGQYAITAQSCWACATCIRLQSCEPGKYCVRSGSTPAGLDEAERDIARFTELRSKRGTGYEEEALENHSKVCTADG